MRPIRLFEMFSGFGGASFALKKAGIEFETVGYSEIDKYAIQCYELNHRGRVVEEMFFPFDIPRNYGDCTKIDPDELPDFDLLTGGFPCQSFSVAGKGQGINDDKGRGLLFNDIIRIAEVKKPRWMLLENVKGLLSKKHNDFFEFTKSELTRLGYKFDVRVYKSSDYGNPQKRERVFYVCKLKELNYNPPIKVDTLNIFESKLLEDVVEDKFYLTEKALERLKKGGFRNNATEYKKNWQTPIVADFRYDEGLRPRKDRFSPTITTRNNNTGLSATVLISFDFKKFRYLTPKECFRLMGFFNDEINLDGISDTQKYKLAGNGWDVNLVSKIFKAMFNENI